jgi:TonB family protein
MKWNEQERARPNLAGLTSPVQQAEMNLLLAGMWPPLKPLPVFKYETGEYRASIDFDKTRGEWVCRKTSVSSNKVQELRGGLTELTMALPHGQVEVFASCAATHQQEQELDKDASRRIQAMLEWEENFENGALYSGLRGYLSESQQHEIDEIIRLTLTARQLQFNPKNVAYVFDALSKAGGKLATLMEIAQRNKTERGGVPATVEAATLDTECSTPAECLLPATFESFPEEPNWTVCPEQDHSSSPELMAHTASQASDIGPSEILDANPPSFVEDLQEKVQHLAPVAGFGPQVRTRNVAWSANRIENSPSRQHVLEISGFHLAAFAFVFLFAVISLPIGLTVGRGPLGQWLRDTQKSILDVHVASPALPNHPGETTPRTSTPAAENALVDSNDSSGTNKLDDVTPSEEKSAESTGNAESFAKAPSKDSNSPWAIESKLAANPEAIPGRNGSAGLIARNVPPTASPKPADSPKTVGPINSAPRNPAPRWVVPSMGAASHRSAPSAILVTPPAYGSKPFRVTFPEKPIAASSSFAMTSELTVLVPPQLGPAAAHRPARLQAGELVSFVWPHYPRPGDRYGSAETVKVRTTIGQSGHVQDVKLVSGSSSLLPAAMSAIRLWRYRPTLLNKKPVQVQQDVTIEFRPPQYLSQVRTQHPSHK